MFLEFSCFFYDLTDVGDLISGSSAFSKSNLYIGKFTVSILELYWRQEGVGEALCFIILWLSLNSAEGLCAWIVTLTSVL